VVRLVALPATLFLATAPALAQPAVQPSTARASETALDRYVAAPDGNYRYRVAGSLPASGATVTILDMTSQQWLSEREIDRPVWTHWLTVVRPDTVKSDVGFLYITGGENDGTVPTELDRWMIETAKDTGTVVAQLRMVPNQPLVFQDDPRKKPREEDDFIAYTWDKFLRTGDERWPARLPMTKAAVRALDTITAFSASAEGGAVAVRRFVVMGGSKRGWTTWTTAAVDRRVVAIIPAVIDLLNVEPSFIHHWRAYGFWAPAVQDYVDHHIMEWMGTAQFRKLLKLVEPYEYRDRLTMAKFIVNASGDQFFLPDSSQFYFKDLKGEKYLRYIPNADHSLKDTDAIQSAHAFYASIVAGTPRPRFSWTLEADGSIRVVAVDRPASVTMWQATNPDARDFRMETLGPAYKATALEPVGPNTWVARVEEPARGWTAFFIELTYPSGGAYPFKFTTDIRVLPDTLPFAPPTPRRPAATAASGK
jgi:PhoPQ-activated pathogenicity-related protein